MLELFKSSLSVTVITSFIVAIILLLVRVLIMQRIQRRRQRENRQETERLKSLVSAYRALAGSFSPVNTQAITDTVQIEEALSEVILFGSITEVRMAAKAACHLKKGEVFQYQNLVNQLRDELRQQLGLDAIPDSIEIPPAGPGRANRNGERGNAGGGGNNAGGGQGGGGGALGGMGVGVMAAQHQEATEVPSGGLNHVGI